MEEPKTTRDAAERLGVSPRMVRKLIKQGLMISVRVGNQHILDEHEINRVARDLYHEVQR